MRDVRVFVSSPGDLRESPDAPEKFAGEPADKRKLVANVVRSLNERPSLRERYKFIPYLYEELTPPVTGGDDAQTVVNQQMLRPRDTDIVVVLLWSRMGTPLAEINPDTGRNYESGTEYEFYDAYRTYRRYRRPVPLLYRYTAAAPAQANPEQIAKVIAFFDRFNAPNPKLRGLYRTFDSPEALEHFLVTDIEALIAKWESLGDRLLKLLLQPLMLPLLAVLVGLAVVLFLLLRAPALDHHAFQVAVGGFSIAPGLEVDSRRVAGLSDAFYNSLKVGIDGIIRNTQLDVGLWSPQQVGQVADETQADALVKKWNDDHYQVDVVIYGIVTRQADNQYRVDLRFNVSDRYPDTKELRGGFDVSPGLTVSSADLLDSLSKPVADRALVLTAVVQGLAQMSITHDYIHARSAFDNAKAIAEPQVQGLVAVLMGNASLSQYNRRAIQGNIDPNHPDELAQLLAQARGDFEGADNNNYARAYIGLASVDYLTALQTVPPDGDWGQLDETRLTEIENTFEKALTAPESSRPESADIPLKVQFGTGQVYLLRYLGGDEQAGDEAASRFDGVIQTYTTDHLERVREFAAQAYGYRALIQAQRQDYDGANKYYDQAINLTQLDVYRQLFQRNKKQVEINEKMLDRDVDGVAKSTQELVRMGLPAADEAQAWSALAKLYSENQRRADAIDAYQKALANKSFLETGFRAYLLTGLADAYYKDGCRSAAGTSADRDCLVAARDAYTEAYRADPDGFSTLKGVIDRISSLLNATETDSATLPAA